MILPVLLVATSHFTLAQMPANAEKISVLASSGGEASITKCVQSLSIGTPSYGGPCVEKVYTTGAINTAVITITTKIDGLNNTTNSRLDDLGLKVNSLNKRMSEDEAALPGQIDQLAVEKLIEKIRALEARVKELESKLNVSKP
jgi:hypothetical protein